jgi:FG-GAP repeat
VLYGSASGLTRTGGQLFTQVGSLPEPYDRFWEALAVGDFNNNGFADLAAGTPGETLTASAALAR